MMCTFHTSRVNIVELPTPQMGVCVVLPSSNLLDMGRIFLDNSLRLRAHAAQRSFRCARRIPSRRYRAKPQDPGTTCLGAASLEAGPLSQWLFSALAEAGLPVICVETPRHMQGRRVVWSDL